MNKRKFAIVLVAMLVVSSLSGCYYKEAKQREDELLITNKNAPDLSAENFAKIKEGMTPEEVLEIAKTPPAKHVKDDNGNTTGIDWPADGGVNVYSISFEDGKVSSPQYIEIQKLKEKYDQEQAEKKKK